MKPLTLLISVFVTLPYNAFAHVGHTGSNYITSSGHFELLEATLVAAVLIFYALSRHVKSMKKIISRHKQQNKHHK